jgi:hypothetical protein
MDRPTDELIQRMLAAAAGTSSDRADALIDQARAEAEAEVKELVKSAMKAVLLRRAVDRLEGRQPPAAARPVEEAPAPVPAAPLAEAPLDETPVTETPAPAGCYVYGITRASSPLPPGLRALDGRSPLRAVVYEDLRAVTSAVSLQEFGPASLDERLKDLQWVEEKVRGHDNVLKALVGAGTVIPCRFCTILAGEGDARAVLARGHDAIAKTLESLDGKLEWGVKVLADTRGAPPAAAEPEGDQPTGRSYLMQKKRHGRQREDVVRAANDAAEACHRELSALAAGATVLPTRDRGGARGWHLALNAAYLVPDTDTETFHARVASLSTRHRPQGVRIDLTGPWPPYNFAALDLSEASA